MKNIKITKENYEGYCELYKSFHFSNEDNKKLGRNTCLVLAVLLFCMIALPILQVSGTVIGISCYTSLALVAATFIGTAMKLTKDKLKDIKATYPELEVKVDFDELVDALENAKILKYKDAKKTEFVLDLEAFNQNLKCEEEFNKYIEETKYQAIEIVHEIPEEQLEKAKVKRLVRR